MKVKLSRGGGPLRQLADLPRPGTDELASMALLTGPDVSNDQVLAWFSDRLSATELAEVAATLHRGGVT